MKMISSPKTFLFFLFSLNVIVGGVCGFLSPSASNARVSLLTSSSIKTEKNQRTHHNRNNTPLFMAQITETEAKKNIDKVVAALRRDKSAKEELGNLVKVTNVLGFGSPSNGKVAVRFNAQFKKGGMGRSSIPLPFGLGQSNESEGRGTMVGQVKASVDQASGKIESVSVFKDLGYGKSFNLKV